MICQRTLPKALPTATDSNNPITGMSTKPAPTFYTRRTTKRTATSCRLLKNL